MNKLFYVFMLIVLCLQTLAYNTIDHDYWARLLQGNAFWITGHIMKQDIFSYVNTHLWIDHEWGASAVFSFLQNNFGFAGILVFKTLLVFLIFLLIFKTIKLQTEKNNNLLNIIMFSAGVYSMPVFTQSGLRCHFFTFFFFALFLYLLELVRKKGRTSLLFLLPVLFLIWFNMHGGCVSGLGLLLIYSIGGALNRKPFKNYLYTFAGCLAVMLINPYGIDYAVFVFTAALMPRPYITEWISPFLYSGAAFMLPFKVFYLVSAAAALKNIKPKADYTKLLLLIITAAVSFKNIKSSPFFIIASMIFLYEDFLILINAAASKIKIILNEKFCRFLEFSSASAVIVFSVMSINSFFFLSEQPYKAVEFMRINRLKGKLLAPMEMGSYAAYKLFPNILIYMDGRYEEVYYKETKQAADNFYNALDSWQNILNDKPDYILIPLDAYINNLLQARGGYRIIWQDEKNILYTLNDNIKPLYFLPESNLNYYIKHAFD